MRESHTCLTPATAQTKKESAADEKPAAASEKPSEKADVKKEVDEKKEADGANDEGEYRVRWDVLFGWEYIIRVERHRVPRRFDV